MVEVEQLGRTFGRRTALADVSFRVEPGEAVMLLGPNGSGKTTLLRVLSGFLPATSGFAQVAGHELLAASRAARAEIGYVPENAPIYAEMRVVEYLRFRGRLRHLRGRALRRRTEAVVEQCGLPPFHRELIGTLSRGQRMRVALADALLHGPAVLLLDDPLATLDLEQRRQILDVLATARGSATLIVSTHFPDELAPLCGRLVLLRAGRLAQDRATDADNRTRLQDRVAAWLAEPATQGGPEAPCATS